MVVTEKNMNDLLDVLYRRGCSQWNGVLLAEAKVDLRQWDDDTFFNTAQAILDNNLIFINRLCTFFTLDGCRRVESLKAPAFIQCTVNANNIINSQIQQNSLHATQTATYTQQDPEKLRRLVDAFEKHIDDLGLDEATKQRATVQVRTIKTQLEDQPNSVIIKEAGRTLRNLTEGAVASLIATAAQPNVWALVHSILRTFQ
jgi:hypothetical protein